MDELVTDVSRAKETLKGLPLGSVYYKCYVNPYGFRGKEIDGPEFWGYAFVSELKQAKALFSRAIDDGLDILDYGYMEIVEMEVRLCGGSMRGVAKEFYVNDFGKWKKRDVFLKRFGAKA